MQRNFPERASAYIVNGNARGHMFNFSPFGGYLALKLGPEREVFMDGRLNNARDASLVVRADQAYTSEAAFQQLIGEFDMQYAVMSAREGERFGIPLARSQDWALVHWDDVAAVYVRRQGPNAMLAEAGYRSFRHLSDLGEVLRLAVQGGSAAPALQARRAAGRGARSEQRPGGVLAGLRRARCSESIWISERASAIIDARSGAPRHPATQRELPAPERGSRRSALMPRTPELVASNRSGFCSALCVGGR